MSDHCAKIAAMIRPFLQAPHTELVCWPRVKCSMATISSGEIARSSNIYTIGLAASTNYVCVTVKFLQ